MDAQVTDHDELIDDDELMMMRRRSVIFFALSVYAASLVPADTRRIR
jgi:hypothetical protein